MKMRCSGFPIMDARSYYSKMKQNNSTELSVYSCYDIYSTPPPDPLDPKSAFFPDFPDFLLEFVFSFKGVWCCGVFAHTILVSIYNLATILRLPVAGRPPDLRRWRLGIVKSWENHVNIMGKYLICSIFFGSFL